MQAELTVKACPVHHSSRAQCLVELAYHPVTTLHSYTLLGGLKIALHEKITYVFHKRFVAESEYKNKFTYLFIYVCHLVSDFFLSVTISSIMYTS